MKSLSKCKVCGYIIETDLIKGVCPACGLPAKVFEPYTLTVSEKRYQYLALHIHPIMLHFPQAFVATALGLLILSLFFTGTILDNILIVTKFNLLFLPLLIILGGLSGYQDGKMRFKKVTTPILQKKIKLSIAFFALSIIAAVVAFVVPFTLISKIALILIVGIALAIAIVLGVTGGKLTGSIIGGK